MFTLIIQNTENDKTLTMKYPIVPRKGDWIFVDDDEFAENERYMTVTQVILDPRSYSIWVQVDTSD